MLAQKDAPLYEAPVLTLRAIAEKMNTMDKEVKKKPRKVRFERCFTIANIVQVKMLVNKAKNARTKRLKELAEKLKEFDKKANETTDETKKESAEKKDKDKNADDTKGDSETKQSANPLDDDHVEL